MYSVRYIYWVANDEPGVQAELATETIGWWRKGFGEVDVRKRTIAAI